MARLRDPDSGCPWDTRQTFRTIVPHTLEEAYDPSTGSSHLADALADPLFQVIFYRQMGQEENQFDFDSVVDNLVRKLVRRHPHVFPDGTLESRIDPDNRPGEAEIKANWERIKAEERAAKPEQAAGSESASRLEGIARTLPAMVRAEKLQRRAANHGFDWPDVEPVFDKLHEEIDELKEAWHDARSGAGKVEAVEDELGDLLFVCVNLARFMKVNPEQALNSTNHKFEARFRAIEEHLEREGRDLDGESLEAFRLASCQRG